MGAGSCPHTAGISAHGSRRRRAEGTTARAHAQLRAHLVWRAARRAERLRKRGAGCRRAGGEVKLFASLDARDRKLLVGTLSVTLLVVVVTAIFARDPNNDNNPVPSTYRTGRYGAQAAYDLLQSSGYHVQRWEQPLGFLAQQVS